MIILPTTITIENPFRLELILIPKGEFLMGSDKAKDKQAYDSELPQHKLTLPNYYLAKHPVTNAQYAVFAKAAEKEFSYPSSKYDHPVVNVIWCDAVAFCVWLQQNLESLADLQGFKVCLPTEAEWEKAARGIDGRIYPWGNEWDATRCNSGIKDTTHVGNYPPRGVSPYGIADMSGNVWEWCQSKYKPYPYNANDGREIIDKSDDIRVLRGSAFFDTQREARCAGRGWYNPSFRVKYGGFRLVASPF